MSSRALRTHAEPSALGSAQALVLQSDYVAAQERAFRVRHF
jgi:hypothetical protein